MKGFLILSIYILLAGTQTLAGEYIALDAEVSLQSIDGNGIRRLEFCQNGVCEIFPKSPYLDMVGLPGDLDWNQIFDECRSFSDLNDFLFYTEVLSSIATFYIPTNTLRNLRLTKQVLTRWGTLGKVAGNRFVFDSAVVIGGTSAMSLPVDLFGHNQSYPEIAKEDIESVRALFNAALADNNAKFFFESRLIEAIAYVAKTCSSQLENRLRQVDRRQCMNQCHELHEVESADTRALSEGFKLQKSGSPSREEISELDQYLMNINQE